MALQDLEAFAGRQLLKAGRGKFFQVAKDQLLDVWVVLGQNTQILWIFVFFLLFSAPRQARGMVWRYAVHTNAVCT